MCIDLVCVETEYPRIFFIKKSRSRIEEVSKGFEELNYNYNSENTQECKKFEKELLLRLLWIKKSVWKREKLNETLELQNTSL